MGGEDHGECGDTREGGMWGQHRTGGRAPATAAAAAGGLTLLAWARSMGAAALRVCTHTLARTAGVGRGGASA